MRMALGRWPIGHVQVVPHRFARNPQLIGNRDHRPSLLIQMLNGLVAFDAPPLTLLLVVADLWWRRLGWQRGFWLHGRTAVGRFGWESECLSAGRRVASRKEVLDFAPILLEGPQQHLTHILVG